MQILLNFFIFQIHSLLIDALQWTPLTRDDRGKSEKVTHKYINECLFKFDMYKFSMMASKRDHPLRFALKRYTEHLEREKTHSMSSVHCTMFMSKWIYEIWKGLQIYIVYKKLRWRARVCVCVYSVVAQNAEKIYGHSATKRKAAIVIANIETIKVT